VEAKAGNSILDFETQFSDFQEILNGSGLTCTQCSGAFLGWVVTYHCGLLEKLLEKLAPFEKFQSGGKEEARPGGGIMENCWKRSCEKYTVCINFVYYNIMHCDL